MRVSGRPTEHSLDNIPHTHAIANVVLHGVPTRVDPCIVAAGPEAN